MKIQYLIPAILLLVSVVLVLYSLSVINITTAVLIIIILLLIISLLRFYLSIVKLEKQNRQLRRNHTSNDNSEALEKNYKPLFENSPNPMWIYDTNSLNFLDVNGAAVAHYGYSKNEFLSMKIGEIIPEKELHLYFKNASPGSNSHIYSNSLHNIKKGGVIIDVELSSQNLTFQNNIESRLIIINDVTEKYKLIRALKESEEHFRTLTETSASSIFIFNEDGFKYVNPATVNLTGFSKEDFMKMKFWDIIHPDMREIVKERGKSRLNRKQAEPQHEVKILTKDGGIKWFEYKGSNIEFEGKPAILGNAFDITERKNAELLLKESEARFAAFMDSIPIAVFILDESSRIIYANKYFRKIHNILDENIYGQSFYNSLSIPNYLADKIKEDDQKAFKEGLINVTETLPDINGVLHTFKTTKFPIRNVNQKMLLGCYQIDLTEKLKADDELLKSKQEYQSFFEDDLTSDYISTPDGKLKTCNTAFLRTFGFKSIEEAKNTNMVELYPDPEIRGLLLKELKNNGRLNEFESEVQKIDGTKLYIIEKVIGSFNDAGELIELRGYIIDNTHRKLAETELRKLSRAVEQSPVSIVITDANGIIQYVNPKFQSVTGYSSKEVVGENPRILKSGEKSSEDYKIMWETIKSGKLWHGEFHNKKKNGELYWELATISPVFNVNGDIENFLAVKEDITERKLWEKLLIESEKKFRTLFESANEGTFLLYDSNIIDCNEKALEIFKTTKKHLIGKTPADFSPEYQPNGMKSGIEAAQKIQAALDGTPQVFEWLHTKADGSFFLGEINLIKIEVNNVKYVLAFIRDITNYKKAVETLKINEQKYRDIFNWAPVGIYQSTNEGKIITANPALIQILGYNNIKEFLNCNMYDLYYNKEDRKKLIEIFDKPGASAAIDINLLWKEKNGTPIWISLTSHAVRDKEGKTIYYEGFVYDISERKKSEEELIKLSLAVEQSPASIVITDTLGNIQYVNRGFQETTGYKLKEVFNKNPRVLKSGYTSEAEYRQLWESVLAGKTWRGEFLNKKKNGELFWEDATISPIIDKKGEIISLLAVKEDITDKKKITEELISAKVKAEEMNKLKSIFLANMSHELRTPLIGILGYSEMLKNDVPYDNQLEMAETIYKSGKRLTETLNLILELSKVESEIESARLIILDSNSVIHESENFFRNIAAQKGLEFTVIPAKENIYIEADPELLRKVLNNLISNAIKYTSSGTVKVYNKIQNDKVKIIVEDTGIGIPVEDREKIFEPFRQVSEGLDRRYEGTGLGLTISKKYVEMMNGIIRVESVEGKGSKFIIEMPLPVNGFFHFEKEPKLNTSQITSALKPGNNHNTPKVLIVENDNTFIKIFTSFLKNEFTIDTARSDEEAIRKIKESDYDCILIDIKFRNEKAYLNIASEIKKDVKYMNTPIIAITSFKKESETEKLLVGGFTHYLTKPFEKSKLTSFIKNVIYAEKEITIFSDKRNNYNG